MKRSGILNGKLMGALTDTRHMEVIMVCDAGSPVGDKTVIDLSAVEGLPTTLQVVEALFGEFAFEKTSVMEVVPKDNPELYAGVNKLAKGTCDLLTFDEFIATLPKVKFFIRTGDLTPCANVVLTMAKGHFED